MATERQVEEAVARCVATMVLYHNEGRTRSSTLAMKAEVRATAAHVSGLGVTGAQSGERVFLPVEAELIARYGPEAGRRLHREFVRAYDGRTTGPDPILSPAKV